MKIWKVLLVTIIVFGVSGEVFSQTRKRRTTKKPTVTKTTNTTTPVSNSTSNNTNLTDNEINSGLKEALFKGVRFAVDSLGRENGFLNNAKVKIPLPNSLQKMEKTWRVAGQGRMVDEFIESMNHAAEKAVPVAVDVFVDSIKQMTFNDVRNILFSGQDDAATQFFRRTSGETLRGKFRPIVEKFTNEVGVTQNYKDMMGKYGFVGRLFGQDATDIDGYVTEKALDGLFYVVAEEERKIRKDPIGTGSSILQKVFGAIFK